MSAKGEKEKTESTHEEVKVPLEENNNKVDVSNDDDTSVSTVLESFKYRNNIRT